jgi:hypothetical protein
MSPNQEALLTSFVRVVERAQKLADEVQEYCYEEQGEMRPAYVDGCACKRLTLVNLQSALELSYKLSEAVQAELKAETLAGPVHPPTQEAIAAMLVSQAGPAE